MKIAFGSDAKLSKYVDRAGREPQPPKRLGYLLTATEGPHDAMVSTHSATGNGRQRPLARPTAACLAPERGMAMAPAVTSRGSTRLRPPHRTRRVKRKHTADTAAEAGRVTTHATTIEDATFHLTADARRDAPTPTIAPVMVWVVETGMPR